MCSVAGHCSPAIGGFSRSGFHRLFATKPVCSETSKAEPRSSGDHSSIRDSWPIAFSGYPRGPRMIPSEDSSGGKQRLGHISKQGNSLLRFLLVEAAQAAARIHPEWRRRYTHLAMRRHRSIAKVAMGRRLAIRLYWMWRNGCEYSQSLEFGSYVGQLGTGHGVK